VVTGGVNGFNAIEDRPRLRGVLLVGRVKAQRRLLEVRSWAVRGGRMRWDLVAAQPQLTGAGWERELTHEAHVLVRGEREEVVD
jgi:hypothetical protein